MYVIKRKFRGLLGDDVDNSQMASFIQQVQVSTAGVVLEYDNLTINRLVVIKSNRIPVGTDKY